MNVRKLTSAVLLAALCMYCFGATACGVGNTSNDEVSESSHPSENEDNSSSGRHANESGSSRSGQSNQQANEGVQPDISEEDAAAQEVEPERPQLSFPSENAEKALIVSFTNIANIGSMRIDRGDYDESDLHNYGDEQGTHFPLLEHGLCRTINESSCHISELEVSEVYEDGRVDNRVYILEATVDFDGQNYVISDMDTQYRPGGDKKGTRFPALYGAGLPEDCPLFVISQSMIE